MMLALVMLLLVSTAAIAQEPAKYNFASAQESKDIKVFPGGKASGIIYFYNIDGNQITHIILEVIEAPPEWQVEIQPPLEEIQVEIGGKIVTISENLHIQPSPVISEKIEDPPKDKVCIEIPQRGYTLANEARINVQIPDSEKIGRKSEVTISGVAQWLGQSGAVAITQSRDFNFSVEIVAPTNEEPEENILGKKDSSANTGNWLPWIIGCVGVFLGAGLVTLYMRKRRE